MAAQPQQTLTATNANSKHSSLLTGSSCSSSSSSSGATLPSPHLAHYQGGRLGCPSELDGRGSLGGHTATRPPVSHPNFSSSSSSYASPPSSSSFLSSSAPAVPFAFSPLSTSSSSSSTSPSSHSQTPRPASRRARPCSLCGTKALSPQPTYLSTPAFGVLEQPIVLLHRLEDGLPRGDLRSLHAFGTIRLLPVQSAAKGCVGAPEASSGENTGYDGGESQIRQAMEDATEGCTQEVLYDRGSPFGCEKNATRSDGETNSERLEESDTETGVESVFLEESYPLEAIVDTEVAVVSNHSDRGDKLLIRENNCVKTPAVSSWCVSDSECSDTHHVRGDKVKSVRDQGSDNNKNSLPNNHNSMNAVFRYQDSESEKRLVRRSSAVEAESDSPILLQSCDKIKENSSPSDKQLLSAKNLSVPSTKCPSTLLTNCVSTTSVKALPGFTSPSYTVATSCKQTTSATKAVAYQCSSSVVQRTPDSFIAYSPKMRHSPVSWSPHTASPNVCESPALISNSCTSPEISASPTPSPPSPCESPSLPFSPPPSPAPEFIQSDSAGALGKGESQSFPLSPYSPGSSPSSPISPAPPLSPCDSPPSPCASADSPQTPLEEERPSAPLEQNDVMEDASETVGLPCTPSESGDNCTASQHSLMISRSSEFTSETNAQVEYQLGVTDELKPKQISSESTDSVDSLGQSEDFECESRETDVRSSLDSCSSSNDDEKPVNAESDLNYMKLKVRLRPKMETPLPTEKFSNDNCNKNGIPKIVLTLRGNGPNKEYSCSNKVRSDGQSSSKAHVMHRKHKSKKDKKERERNKMRKAPRGNKYKRHLELFGEDSNDSLGLERCDNNGIAGRCDDSLRDPEKSKDAESPSVVAAPGEPGDNSEDSFFWPIPGPGYSYSENIERVCEKVKQVSPKEKHIQEDSFSDYLPDLDPVPSPKDSDGKLTVPKMPVIAKDEVFRAKTPAFVKKEIKFQRGRVRGGVLAKKRLLLSKKQGRSFLRNWHSKQVSKCLRIKQKSKIKKEPAEDQTTSDFSSEVSHSKVLGEDHSPLEKPSTLSPTEKNTCESVPSTPSLTVQETVSVNTDNSAKDTGVQKVPDISSVVKKESEPLGKNEHSSQEKLELSYLRARPERTTKKCETGQDSDSCLWVSFGVNRPVPVPASDLPILEPETEVRGTVKLEYSHSEGKRKIHDNITHPPKPQTTSVNIPQTVDCKTVADKSASATIPLDVKNSSATPGNSLSFPSSDQETSPLFDEELSQKKGKYSKQDGIIPNNIAGGGQSGEARENIPDLPPGNVAVKNNIVKPHIRLRSAPRPTAKVMEQPKGNQQSTSDSPRCAKVSKISVSRDIGDKNQKLESSSLSQPFFLSSGGPESGDIKQDKLKHSEIAAEDSVKTTPPESEAEESQYYRPKKIQKVLDENVQKPASSKAQLDALYPEAKDSEKTSNNDNCLRFTEETVTHSSADKDSSCEDDKDPHNEVFRPAAEVPASEYSASRNDKETLESGPDNGDRGNLLNVDVNEQNENLIIPPPHDPEFDKVWADRLRKKWKTRRRKQSAKSTREGGSELVEKSGETPSEEPSAPCKDSVASKGVASSAKQNKEAAKKHRKPRKRDESGSGARITSAFEAIQQTLEVKSVEERGRRLAQEIKGFNWLEEKIKNSSLNRNVSPSASSPSTAKRLPPPLLPQSQSLPATLSVQSPTPLSPSNPLKRKDEPPLRRNSFTGCSATGGLKGHLQTAVPPLLPSYRVTALPKRSRLSPPCSSVSLGGGGVVMSTAASSNNSVLTQENPSTSMGVSYGPEPVSGTAVAATLQETVASLHSLPDSDRATLYSSTDSNTATLYGVSNPQLEVLFEDAVTASDSLYKKNPDPTLQNISVSFPHLLSARASEGTYPYSLTTSAPAKGGHGVSSRDRQCSTVVSNSNPRVSTGSGSPQPTSSTSPSPIPVFSQKHILLKRAFMDMMKDTENAPESRSPSLEADVKISPKDGMPEEKPLKAVGPEEGSQDHSLKKTTTSDADTDRKDAPNQEEKIGELPKIGENSVKKDEEEKVINALPADVKQTLLKSTTKSESSETDTKSSSEMHPAILFSMLYEELQRTRQEVERLRKQQEMMLTEKSEKVEEKIVKNEFPVKEETVSKDRPQSQNSSSVGNQSDDDSVEICEEKPAKISIRSDLLAPSSQASAGDKVPVQTTQVSTIMTHDNISPIPSVSVPDRQLISPLAKKSPTLPQMSPQLCQTSPRSSQVSPLTRTSPVVNPHASPVTHHVSYPAPVQAVEVSTIQSAVPLPHTSPTPSHINVVSLYSTSGSLRASPVLPRNSPIISRQSPSSSSSPAVPKSSPALPKSSPIAPLCSPRGSKDITVVDINSETLRSKYGINTEVEVMPVPTNSKPQLSEPQPHAYLEVIEYQKPQDTPLLLEAVKGRRLDSSSSSNSSSSTSSTINERPRVYPQSTLAQHLVGDHVKRTMHSQAVDSEIKRSRFSTSDLPEFPPSSQKPPPPLKPVASLQRRYSDNVDARKAEPIMVHFPSSSMPGFPSTSEHSASPLNFPQPRSSVTQNTILSPHVRCSDGNTDRTREYQQQFNLQYQRQIGPCPPALRSLGPDKATIFPIPAPSSSSIQPYGKPHTPPAARGSVIEQHKASIIESASAGVFPKLKQTIQQSFDAQVAGATSQERVQPPAISFEKTRQPQTFAARVLVRDSVPETVPRLPPPPYSSQHYSNCNPHLPTVLPNHHYLNNMHHSTGTNLHHIVAGGLIRRSLQPSSTNIHSHTSNPRSNTSSGSSDRKRCLSCPQPAKFLCSGCKKAWYCSENCQREHWALHNTSCVP
ncbi:platelet binding protein GspB-like isoform X2 [Macrobrachium rosenbergii]|uniref:platelet binding protein GspB-like isoform X2 n=1 Tax=Macrobrachium rosenbergii TaxID=79674 RepID=UPI0034D72A1D